MKKSILPIIAGLAYLSTACHQIDKIGVDETKRPYKSISSSFLISSAKSDEGELNYNIEKFRKSLEIDAFSNIPVQEDTYLDRAIQNLDDFVEKLSDVVIRYDLGEFKPSQKRQLESNVIEANNELIDISLDSFLQGSENKSQLTFVALEPDKQYGVVKGLIIKEDSGKDNGGNYAIASAYLNGKEVVSKQKIYLDNQDTNIDGLYKDLIDPK